MDDRNQERQQQQGQNNTGRNLEENFKSRNLPTDDANTDRDRDQQDRGSPRGAVACSVCTTTDREHSKR